MRSHIDAYAYGERRDTGGSEAYGDAGMARKAEICLNINVRLSFPGKSVII